jgi:mono/diheme cytochrome c family protein
LGPLFSRHGKSGVISLTGFILAVTVTLSSIPVASGATGDPVRGKKIYQGLCIQCHGVKGDGNGVAAPALMEKPANFTDPKTWQMGDEAFYIHVIRRGRKIMPAFWDVIDPQQIRDVLSYERTFLKK